MKEIPRQNRGYLKGFQCHALGRQMLGQSTARPMSSSLREGDNPCNFDDDEEKSCIKGGRRGTLEVVGT